jgi:hypothetical protein
VDQDIIDRRELLTDLIFNLVSGMRLLDCHLRVHLDVHIDKVVVTHLTDDAFFDPVHSSYSSGQIANILLTTSSGAVSINSSSAGRSKRQPFQPMIPAATIAATSSADS